METKRFYKYSDGNLQFSNSVIAQDYILVEEEKDTVQFPVDEWYWFDNEEEAKHFFNIPKQIMK